MVCFFISRTEKLFEVFAYMFVFIQQAKKTTKI